MDNQLNEENREVEKEKLGIEYRLELINFQDQLFQARKKLRDSETKMASLEEKLKNYLRNKENQISEVMFTAHINAQRIEAQTKTQVGFFLQEMEREIVKSQKQLDLLEGKLAAPEPKEPLHLVNDSPDVNELATENSEPTIQYAELDSAIIENDNLTQIKPDADGTFEILPSDQDSEPCDDRLPATEAEPKPRVSPPTHRRFRRKIGYKAVVKPKPIIGPDPDESMVNIFTGKQDEVIPQEISREQQERIRCDAFVDVRFCSQMQAEKALEHHALYVAAEVFVPASNYAVRYTKVSADVVATLMRYDNVVLNEVYPFDIVEPNLNNIAKYFFNCIQDVLALMDLGLLSLTIHELPDLKMEITSRSRDIDRQMHTGDDMLQDIRRDLPDHVRVEPEPPGNLKSRLSQILKKR